MCEQPGSKNAECAEYRELLASLRHYGNIRFAILALFSTATAAMIALSLGNSASDAGTATFTSLLYGLAPIVLSGIFLRLNIHLSNYMDALGNQISHYPHCHLNEIPNFGSTKVSCLFHNLYASILIFWLLNALLFLLEVKGFNITLPT